ncbi:uncharacterized protein LOC125234355 isoform X3 [Leguminivora glycinivorella]|uniref:uncharacterized protein LOC125234355 isoform X3 n=1 Tax=Leguminivora glycinivorella TaxID=1035111 RepID=UPI00200F994E|nr:uncharacterized protein LOC125234355 isoform X3 [Leguminivora glycinivorella]
MPVCSVKHCGIRKTPNQPFLTLHRLPRNGLKKKKWLDAIGMENIRPNVKDIFICSLHFDEQCFNKTLDVTRLRDDAVPLKFQHASQYRTAVLKEDQLETIPILAGSNLLCKKTTTTVTTPAPRTLNVGIPVHPVKPGTALNPASAPVSGTSGIATSAPCKKTTTTVTTHAPGTLNVGIPVHPVKPGTALNPASAPVSGTSGIATPALPLTTAVAYTAPSVPGTSRVDNLPQHASQHRTAVLKEDQLETIPILAGSNLHPVKPGTALNPASAPVSGTSGIATSAPCKKTTTTVTTPAPGTLNVGIPVHPVKPGTALNPASAPVSGTSGIATPALPLTTAVAYTAPSVPGTSRVDNLPVQTQKIKKLEDTCDFLRKKVRRLNEMVRRQRKKIAEFQYIIKDLQERNVVNNENSIVLEACAGPKDFLKRHILKSEGSPSEKQYSEETRKFALTLHSFSPKAYNFVRRTFNTCLPHPRTLFRWYQKINAEPGLCVEAFAAP